MSRTGVQHNNLHACAAQHHDWRPRNDREVAHQPDSLKVPHIHRHAFFVRYLVTGRHLPRPRQAWTHGQVRLATGPVQFQLIHNHRAWTGDAHVTDQNIPKLRQLVESRYPQDPAGARYPRIVFQLPVCLPLFPGLRVARKQRGQALLGIHTHGSEFPALERASILSDSGMSKKDWPTLADEDDRGDDAERKNNRQENRYERYVNDAFPKPTIQTRQLCLYNPRKTHRIYGIR